MTTPEETDTADEQASPQDDAEQTVAETEEPAEDATPAESEETTESTEDEAATTEDAAESEDSAANNGISLMAVEGGEGTQGSPYIVLPGESSGKVNEEYRRNYEWTSLQQQRNGRWINAQDASAETEDGWLRTGRSRETSRR